MSHGDLERSARIDHALRALGVDSLDDLLSPDARASSAAIAASRAALARHGDLDEFLSHVAALPRLDAVDRVLDRDAPGARARFQRRTGPAQAEFEQAEFEQAVRALRALGPWRKGPFHFDFSFEDGSEKQVLIDAEWRSDLKAERLHSLGLPFAGSRVLDVGTGNGYFLLRYRGWGASRVIGIDPSVRSFAQLCALERLLGPPGVTLVPAPFESVEFAEGAFDVVLSMGVIYHRRDPREHLYRLLRVLARGGTLVLESIVVPGGRGECLEPADRYASMGNVFVLPTAETLEVWLEELGLEVIGRAGPTLVTAAEQRSTSWSEGPSLDAFLAPILPGTSPDRAERLTREGHPRPWRHLIAARRR